MNDHCKSTEVKLLLLIVILNRSDDVILMKVFPIWPNLSIGWKKSEV